MDSTPSCDCWLFALPWAWPLSMAPLHGPTLVSSTHCLMASDVFSSDLFSRGSSSSGPASSLGDGCSTLSRRLFGDRWNTSPLISTVWVVECTTCSSPICFSSGCPGPEGPSTVRTGEPGDPGSPLRGTSTGVPSHGALARNVNQRSPTEATATIATLRNDMDGAPELGRSSRVGCPVDEGLDGSGEGNNHTLDATVAAADTYLYHLYLYPNSGVLVLNAAMICPDHACTWEAAISLRTWFHLASTSAANNG